MMLRELLANTRRPSLLRINPESTFSPIIYCTFSTTPLLRSCEPTAPFAVAATLCDHVNIQPLQFTLQAVLEGNPKIIM